MPNPLRILSRMKGVGSATGALAFLITYVGLYIAAKLGDRTLRHEYRVNDRLLGQGMISYQEALTRITEARYYRAKARAMLFSKKSAIIEENNWNLEWLTRNVMPKVAPFIPWRYKNDLRVWVNTLDSLSICLGEVHGSIDLWHRLGFGNKQLVEQVVDCWKKRYMTYITEMEDLEAVT